MWMRRAEFEEMEVHYKGGGSRNGRVRVFVSGRNVWGDGNGAGEGLRQ